MNNSIKVNTIPISFLQISYGFVIIFSVLIFFINFFEFYYNPFYSNYSLFLFVIFSIITYKIAIENTVETFILSFMLVTAFSQRIIITYFYPDSIDFQKRLEFSSSEIEYALLFLTLCAGASLLGFIFGRRLSFKTSIVNESTKNRTISFFILKFKEIRFLKSIIWFYIILVIIKLLIIIITGVGITGKVHSQDQSLIHWISTRSLVIKDYAMFGVLLLLFQKQIKKLKILFFITYFVESLIAASRSILLSIFQTLVIIHYILKKEIKWKFFIYAILIVVFFGGFSYIIISMLRNYLMQGDFTINAENVFLLISRSFSQYEPLLLWMEMPKELYSSSVGFINDLIAFINSFAIGDLISDNDRVNLGKLMVQYGRQNDFDILSLGGHAENPGPFGITFIYLGLLGGAIYWFLQSLILSILMNSNFHSVWKFIFITFFAFGPTYYLYVNIIFLINPLIILGFGLVFFDLINKIFGNKAYFTK